MSTFEAETRAEVLTDLASSRRWFVSPLGRYVLTIGQAGVAAIAMENGAPVRLQKPRPDFVWPTELFIDDRQSTVTAVDGTRRRGETAAWTWTVPRRLVPTIVVPEPTGVLEDLVPVVRFTESAPSGPHPAARAVEEPVTSADRCYSARYDDGWEPGLIVTDLRTGAECIVEAGWFSRRWPVGGPWWSDDNRWLLCSWYTTKSIDHGWISALSRADIDNHFGHASSRGSLEWTVTGYPNGDPADDDGRGTWDAVRVAGFSSDASCVYFVDSETVSGFSFPHMVPLFRLDRPELAVVRQSVPVPTAGTPHAAWASDDQLVVATREGQVGSVWLEFGLGWVPEVTLGSSIVAFDANGIRRAALTSVGQVLVWTVETEPTPISEVPHLVERTCQIRLVDSDHVLVAGGAGTLLSLSADGTTRASISTGLPEVASLEVSRDGKFAAAVSLGCRCVRVRLADAGTTDWSSTEFPAKCFKFTNGAAPIWVDARNFVHFGADLKRQVFADGSFGSATAPEIVVVDMGRILARDDPSDDVLALAYSDVRGVAVSLRSGLLSMLNPGTGDLVIIGLGGGTAERLDFNPGGSLLAAASRSTVHVVVALA